MERNLRIPLNADSKLLSQRISLRTATSFDDTAFPLIHTIVRILLVLGAVLVAMEYLGIRVTPLVCYDLRFADLFTGLAARTDLFVVVANWPSPRAAHWPDMWCNSGSSGDCSSATPHSLAASSNCPWPS